MTIKLIVTDMDGTLLNEQIEISNENRDAIKRAQNAGIEFMVATGRSRSIGYPLVEAASLHTPFIGLNGAQAFDEKGTAIYTSTINQKDIAVLAGIYAEYPITHEFMTSDGRFTTLTIEEYLDVYSHVLQNINRQLSYEDSFKYILENHADERILTVKNYDIFSKTEGLKVLKSFVHATQNKEILPELQSHIEAKLPSVNVTSSTDILLEITHETANKGNAIKKYAESKGYKASEVVTIGDNLNDSSMIAWAKHSYAVENAHPKVKELATYQAPHHSKHVIAYVVNQVLTNNLH